MNLSKLQGIDFSKLQGNFSKLAGIDLSKLDYSKLATYLKAGVPYDVAIKLVMNEQIKTNSSQTIGQSQMGQKIKLGNALRTIKQVMKTPEGQAAKNAVWSATKKGLGTFFTTRGSFSNRVAAAATTGATKFSSKFSNALQKAKNAVKQSTTL